MPGDVSNTWLGKLMSVEVLGLLMLGAIAWGALTSNVQAIDDKQSSHKVEHTADITRISAEQKQTRIELNSARNTLTVIGTTQVHILKEQEKQGEKLDDILDIIRREYPTRAN